MRLIAPQTEVDMFMVNELEEGQLATITKIEGDKKFLSRVTSIGLTIGGSIEILRNEKKMPILLYTRDSMVALNRDDSTKIFVEMSA